MCSSLYVVWGHFSESKLSFEIRRKLDSSVRISPKVVGDPDGISVEACSQTVAFANPREFGVLKKENAVNWSIAFIKGSTNGFVESEFPKNSQVNA